MKNIAILGAGISGLTTAFLLKKKGYNVTVFDKSHRAGGYIGTQYKSDYIVEIGPNGFLNNEPKTLDLINQLNLHSELISAKEESRIRYLMFDGKLKIIPAKPQQILKSDILSFGAKLSILKEKLLPPKPLDDISKRSIYEFVKNHFGAEIAENIVRSALVGIFAGDAKSLSVEKTFKKLIKMEKEHKSLMTGLKKSFQETGRSNLMSFKKGLQTLVDKLANELKFDMKLSHEVIHLKRDEGKFVIQALVDEESTSFDKFDEVIITLPANEIARVLEGHLEPSLLEKFKTFPIAPIKTLTFAFKEKIKFKGFGTLISPKEELNILGFLHPKDIFEGRCPEDKDLISVLMGGTFKPEVMKMSTQASVELAIKDLEKIIGPLPPIELFWIWNHSPGISQYNVDQVDFMNELESQISKLQGIHLNSQMLGGIAINDCIRKSFELTSTF